MSFNMNTNSTPETMHAALPHQLSGPMVWTGSELESVDSYTISLNSEEVAEVEAAAKSFQDGGLDADSVSPATFALPTLSAKLKAAARALYDGKGFVMLSGLEPAKYTDQDNLIMYLGISSYIGDERGLQDRKGNMLAHVTDSKQWKAIPASVRHGIHQKATLPFHTDMPAEILSLQVRQCAQEGGSTCIASAWTVYNELALCHAEALKVLVAPNWPIQVSGKKAKFITSPLLEVRDNKVFVCVDASRLGPHPLSGAGEVPNLTVVQVKALSTLMDVAAKHQFRIQSSPGDMVFINNFAMLHAREKYQDGANTSRHLVRMWLRSTTLGWNIPETMRSGWQTAFGERLGHVAHRYPAMPTPEYQISRYPAGSAAFMIEDSDEDEME